jgi:hypothetical protein
MARSVLVMPQPTVFDLRQYTLHPGRRDDLIAVFEDHLVEGQEATGMHISGHFRDLDDPDRFVWLRGFADLEARGRALNDFYYGPVWRAHAGTANATMLDSDNALLLRPLTVRAGFPAPDAPRPPAGATEIPPSVVIGLVYHRRATDDGLPELFAAEVEPVLRDTGAEPVAVLESIVAENNFPPLPLRDEIVLAWFAVLPDDDAYDAHRRELDRSDTWQRKVLPELARRSVAPAQHLRLRPAARSHLR